PPGPPPPPAAAACLRPKHEHRPPSSPGALRLQPRLADPLARSRSAPIVGVDVDVAVSQIAGPDPGLAAANADVDLDQDVAATHVLCHRGLIIALHRLPLLGVDHAADGH